MSRRLVIFYTTPVFLWIALYAYMPYVAPLAEVLGADFRLIGIIAGAYGFTQMLLRFPLGILSDKLQMRKAFIVLGLVFAALSGFVVFFFQSPASLLLSRALAGVSVSSWVIFMILGASYYKREETTKAVGYLNSTNALGRMTAMLLAGFVAERMGLSYAFLLSGIAALIGFVLALGIEEKKPEANAKPPSIKDLLGVARNHQLLSASILAILTQYIPFATAFAFTPVVATGLGATNMQLGLLGFVAMLPSLFISPLAGTLIPKKLGVKNSLVLSFVLAGLGAAAIPFSQSLWQVFVAQTVSNIGSTAMGLTLLMGLCIQDIPNERRGTAMGFFQAVYAFGMFMGPIGLGWISFWLGLNVAFVFTGIIGLTGALLTLLFVSRGYLRYIRD